VRISAAGCVATSIENPGEGDVVVPLLAVSDSVRTLQVSNGGPVELKALGERQRLVVAADADASAARIVFPKEELVTVSLDMNRPLFEPVLAWTAADVIVLSPVARARVSDRQISVLLAAGVAIVVTGAEKPDVKWLWEGLKDAWVLRHEVAGPTGPVRAEAYSPTYAWDRGVPGAVRKRIVFAAVVFSILAVGLSLWRGRYATGAFLGLCAVAGGVVWFVFLRGPRELTMRKAVVVTDSRMAQVDEWVWYGSLGESVLHHTVSEFAIPVFASARQIERCEPRLVCDGQGRPVAYEFRLGRNESLGFLTRSLQPRSENGSAPSYAPTGAVWKEFVSNLYIGSGDRLEGEGALATELDATFVTRARK